MKRKMLSMRRAWLILILPALSIIISSCVDLPSEIIFPEWDVDIKIPVTNRNYTLLDLINSDDNISVQGNEINDSIYVIESDEFRINAEIAEFLEIEGSAQSGINIGGTGGNSIGIFYIDFPDGAQIDSAHILSGSLSVSTENPTADSINIILNFPAFRTTNGNLFAIEIHLPPFTSETKTSNLSGFTYETSSGLPGYRRNSIQISAEFNSNNSAFSYCLADFFCSQLKFNKVTGNLPTRSLGVFRNGFKMNFGNLTDLRGNLRLRDALLKISGTYYSGYNDKFELELVNVSFAAKRDNGEFLLLTDHSGTSNFSYSFSGESLDYTFTNDNSNIKDFIAFLPDSIIVTAEFILNPNHQRGTASVQDSIIFNSYFRTESFIGLKRTDLTDSSNIYFTAEERDQIKDGRFASLYLEVENAIPLNTWIKIDLLDAQYNELFTVTQDNGSDKIFFQAAAVDLNGEVSQSFKSPVITLQLDSTQIEMLSRSYHYRYSVGVETEDAFNNPEQIVAVRPGAWLNFKMYGDVKYNINFK